MLRLFITLYLAVFASFILFIFVINGLSEYDNKIGGSWPLVKQISNTTLQLVDESFSKQDETGKQVFLKRYSNLFGPVFGLVDPASLKHLDSADLEKIKQGKLVSVEINQYVIPRGDLAGTLKNTKDDLFIIYLKQQNTSKIWQLDFDADVDFAINNETFHSVVISGKVFDGIMNLVQEILLNTPEANRKRMIETLSKRYQQRISLKPTSTLDFNALINKSQAISDINAGKVVNITPGAYKVTLVKKLPDMDQLLQFGPVEIPWLTRNFPYLILLTFAMSFATMLFLWIKPLWSNLIKIKKAAEEFGKGNYDQRIKHGKFSPISRVSKAFNAMAERTQRSIRAQKELTSAVSHELRTPVSRMRFALTMLDSTQSPQDRSRYINAINEDIDELDMLLEELLSYARLDQQAPQITPVVVRLKPWFNNTLEKLLPLANDKRLHYATKNIDKHESCLFEPIMMSRVLNNLVQNGLRYADSTVDVALKKEHNFLFITVEDDGRGIPKDNRETIFNPFSRLDPSRDRASGGFGLGLAIVNQIVKAHQGIITIHDSPLGGAKFVVRIPYKAQQNDNKKATDEGNEAA